MGPRLTRLVRSLGERRAFRLIERILQLSDHTGACIQGETAATPARRAETQLLARVRALNEAWSLGLRIEDSAATARRGDLIVHGPVRSVWDSKLYSGRVPRGELRKLARDVRENGAAFGVIVAPAGCIDTGIQRVDGVPIHGCVAGGPSEFACLYLTTLWTADDAERTADAARVARIHAIVATLEANVRELRGTLVRATASNVAPFSPEDSKGPKGREVTKDVLPSRPLGAKRPLEDTLVDPLRFPKDRRAPLETERRASLVQTSGLED